MSHCAQVNICTILHIVSASFNNGWRVGVKAAQGREEGSAGEGSGERGR